MASWDGAPASPLIKFQLVFVALPSQKQQKAPYSDGSRFFCLFVLYLLIFILLAADPVGSQLIQMKLWVLSKNAGEKLASWEKEKYQIYKLNFTVNFKQIKIGNYTFVHIFFPSAKISVRRRFQKASKAFYIWQEAAGRCDIQYSPYDKNEKFDIFLLKKTFTKTWHEKIASHLVKCGSRSIMVSGFVSHKSGILKGMFTETLTVTCVIRGWFMKIYLVIYIGRISRQKVNLTSNSPQHTFFHH